jgi:hypothetical protein
MLSAAIDRLASGSQLSDAEVLDFSRLIDEEKGGLQMVLASHTIAQVARMRPIRDAKQRVYERMLSDDRIANANDETLLRLAQYLDGAEEKVIKTVRDEIDETRPKHVTALILQQQKPSEGVEGMSDDIQNLPPVTRAKLRMLFDVLTLKAQEAHAAEQVAGNPSE